MTELPHIYRTALQAVLEASEAILSIYQSDFTAITKEDGSPVTQADLESSRIIIEHLGKTGIPIISEEQEIPHYHERLSWKENWCVDPLDGTSMFMEKNDEFAINIAHLKNGEPIFGIIADPVQQKVLMGGKEFEVVIANYSDFNSPERWTKIQPKERLHNPVRVICSRSYVHSSGLKYIQSLEQRFGELQFVRKGSALKFFDLVLGNADIYTRFAPTMEWDIAPGQAILNALGGQIVNVENNQPLKYNKEDLFNPQFIAQTFAFLQA